MLIRRCCCSRNLRTGAIISAGWTLVYCIYMLVTSIIRVKELYGHLYRNETPSPILSEFKGKDMLEVWGVLQWSILLAVLSVVISSVVAIIGLAENCPRMLVPWMISVLLMLILDAVGIILSITVMGFEIYIIFFIVSWFIVTLIFTYCELCMLSHYFELKSGRGRARDYSGNPSGRDDSHEVVYTHDSEQPRVAHRISEYSYYTHDMEEVLSHGDASPGACTSSRDTSPDFLPDDTESSQLLEPDKNIDNIGIDWRQNGFTEQVPVNSRLGNSDTKSGEGNSYIKSLECGKNALHIKLPSNYFQSEPSINRTNQSQNRGLTTTQSGTSEPLLDQLGAMEPLIDQSESMPSTRAGYSVNNVAEVRNVRSSQPEIGESINDLSESSSDLANERPSIQTSETSTNPS